MTNNAIVLLDEFDKLRILRGANTDNFCQDYQASLLRMVEGEVCNFKRSEESDVESVDTTDIMFIFLGAFEGLQDIVAKRMGEERSGSRIIGFNAVEGEVPKKTDLEPTNEDIIEYGFKRELIGRVAVRAIYEQLSVDDMVTIMKSCRTSAYRDYQRRFEAMGHKLVCTDNALAEIARIAVDRKMGARGLSAVFSDILLPVMFDLSSVDDHFVCRLTGECVRLRKNPERTALGAQSISA